MITNEEMDAHNDETRRGQEDEIRAKLREKWGAPRRAEELTEAQKQRGGAWGAKLAELESKLGTGFLIGLIGKRGPGKTQLGYELMRAQNQKMKSAKYVVAAELLLTLRASFKNEGESELEIVNRYRKPAFLVIDEIGKRGQSEWEDRVLFLIIDQRYQDMKDTLLISNEDPAEFVKALGPSIASRMDQTGGVIVANWPSFRKTNI